MNEVTRSACETVEDTLTDERFAFILNNTNELKELLGEIETLTERKAKLLIGELPDNKGNGCEYQVPICWVDEVTISQNESLSVDRNILETLKLI